MNKGFTLLELLVVIGIIGILTVLSVANFMSARERAKDSQSKSDLKQIQNALELYKMDQNPPSYILDDNSTFPNTGNPWKNSDESVTYMNKVPGDSSAPYFYLPDPNTNYLTYKLQACLKNRADKDARDCEDEYICDSEKCYILNEP